jgi:hypothetical protein
MLKEIFEQLKEDISTAVPGIKKVARYKGEFEKGSAWNPEFPCCFIRYENYKPVSRSPQGEVLKAKTFLSLYVGDKDIKSPTVLSTVENVIDLFDGSNFKVTVNSEDYYYNITLNDKGSEFYGYFKGVEVYTVPIIIS